jgi:hypothetical protein
VQIYPKDKSFTGLTETFVFLFHEGVTSSDKFKTVIPFLSETYWAIAWDFLNDKVASIYNAPSYHSLGVEAPNGRVYRRRNGIESVRDKK